MKTYELGYYQDKVYIVETVQGDTRIEAQAKIIQREKRHIQFKEVREVESA